MITVEKVLEKNAVESTKVAQSNEELLKTGSVRELKKSPWPWWIGGALLLGAAIWYFNRPKGSGTNEGIPG